MERRAFIRSSAIITTAISLASRIGVSCSSVTEQSNENNKFNLKYAPHFMMFRHSSGKDLLDQLSFISDVGFVALEDNNMRKREVAIQEKISSKMANLGMEMGVFVAHTIYWDKPGLAGGNEDQRKEFLKEIKDSIQVAKRVNAKWMTVVPGRQDPLLNMDYQTSNVTETLRRAADILEPHNLIMVIEPLNHYDHPGQFLNNVSQAYNICREVNSPSCKILFDIYHQQIQNGNIIFNIDLAWKEISYFQCGDNPGRKEPTTGEINYLNLFKHIHNRDYSGIIGMEHGNSLNGKAGEKAVIIAYRKVDSFT